MAEDLGLDPLTGSNSGAVTPAPKPSGPSGFQKFGLAIEAFGAGMQGRTPLHMKLKEQELQQRRQNLMDMENRIQIVDSVTRQVQSLPEDKRQPYLDSITGQYDDPQLKNMLKFTTEAPDILSGMGEAVKKDPMIRSLAAKGKLEGLVSTDAGRNYIREIQFPEHAKEWSTRLPEWQNWARENKPNEYQKMMQDGRLTTSEINSWIDDLPENLKPTPQSRSYFMSQAGQGKLSGVIGMPVITDDIAKKKLEKELAGGESTTLTKHLSELEEAERNLLNVGDGDKASAQRRVDKLKQKIDSETKSGNSDALKEMRNQIILKTAKLKERDPTYQPPAHEVYIVDEFNKANSMERLRRDILEGRGENKELPKISSDEEYEKLPKGAEFIDPKGVKRRKE